MATTFKTFINVRDWNPDKNAVGDGITDDTNSIWNASQELVKNGGGVLYFPKGVYRVRANGRLHPNDQQTEQAPDPNPAEKFVATGVEANAAILIGGSNITLQGEGSGSIIQQDGNQLAADDVQRPWTVLFCFTFGADLNTTARFKQHPEFETGNILVKDLCFRGNISPKQMPRTSTALAGEGAGALLAFIGTPQQYARNIRIVNCLFEDANKSEAVCPINVDDIVFENCRFSANNAYISGVRVRAASSKNLEIDDNEFMNLTQDTPTDFWAEDVVDGVALQTGDRVLLLNQVNPTHNGVYLIDEDFNWRVAPENAFPAASDQMIRIEEGATNKARIFRTRFTPKGFVGRDSTPKYYYEFVVVQGASAPGQNYALTGVAPNNLDNSFPLDGCVILIKDQTIPEENGLYEYNTAGPWKKIPYNRNLLVRVRMRGEDPYGSYFRCDGQSTFSELTATQAKEIIGNPVSFMRVRAAAQTQTALSATAVDGVSLQNGDLVLLAGQTARDQNGIYRWNGSLQRVMYLDTPERYFETEMYLAGLHVTVLEGNTLGGQHFANRTPLRIILPNSAATSPPPRTPIIFLRAHCFMWQMTALTSAPVASFVGQQTIGPASLKSGDYLLVKNQLNAAENGVYVVRLGQWRRAYFDPGPDGTTDEFNVFSYYLGANGFYWRDNLQGSVGAITHTKNTYLDFETCRPQIYGLGPVQSTVMMGNICNCDYIGIGGFWASDGLFWVTNVGGRVIAVGNDVRNFKLEAFQTSAPVTVISNNTLYTNANGSNFGNAVVLALAPPADDKQRVFDVTISNNDVEGANLIQQGLAGYSTDHDADLNITGNTVRQGGGCEILKGRQIVFANNKIYQNRASVLRVFSAGRYAWITGRVGNSGILLSSMGTLKTGDRVAIGSNTGHSLPANVDPKKFYFVRVDSSTQVTLFADAGLTVPVLLTDFHVSAVLHYNLDTAISITGNVMMSISGQNPLGGEATIFIANLLGDGTAPNGTPTQMGVFGQTVICNNVISANAYHILMNRPVAGTTALILANNLYTDENNVPWQGTPSVNLVDSHVSFMGETNCKAPQMQTILPNTNPNPVT